MKFILKLLRSSLPLFSLAAVSSVLSGAGFSGVMAIIHRGIKTNMAKSGELAPLFFLFWLVYGVFAILTTYTITRLSQNVIYELRTAISSKIMKASFKKIEGKSAEMLAILTQDIQTITYIVSRLPSVLTGMTTVLGCYIYMAVISPRLFFLTLGLFMIAMFFFILPLRYFHRKMAKVRGLWDILYSQFHGLTLGLKELLLNRRFRDSYMSDILIPSCRQQREDTIRGEVWTTFFSRIGDLVLLFGLGGLLFSVKSFGWTSFGEFSQFLTITVFTLSPLSTIVAFLPNFGRMSIAVKKIEQAELDLDTAARDESEELVPLPVKKNKPYIHLDRVTHTYFHEKQDKFFQLGPIDLKIKQGETIFLVGGNGSGKSTLAKVLCGLYPPETGRILFSGTEVTPELNDSYRETFSAIFTDYYLFDTLHYIDEDVVRSNADKYLKLLEIDHKVTVKDMKISNINLSEGQKKRLAILKAFLEDKPFYIFDEWAAGQDPYYKKIFYKQILPDLKKANKTLFIISHDEQYFDCADRVLILRDGKLITDGIYYG